jgi:NADH-quinone oxidoreductase subunit B
MPISIQQDRQIVTDPLEEEVNKSVMMTRLEDVLHTAVNWGRKNSLWLLTSVHHAVMLNMRRL